MVLFLSAHSLPMYKLDLENGKEERDVWQCGRLSFYFDHQGAVRGADALMTRRRLCNISSEWSLRCITRSPRMTRWDLSPNYPCARGHRSAAFEGERWLADAPSSFKLRASTFNVCANGTTLSWLHECDMCIAKLFFCTRRQVAGNA